MYYINVLGLKETVYEWREAKEENFNPMAIHLLKEKGFFENCIQIYVDCVGGREWINIKKENLLFE